MSRRILIARKSAVAERLTRWVTMAWRLLTLRCPPFSVTMTGSFSASLSSVVTFLPPDGRPRGLPDWPFRETGMLRRLAIAHLVITLLFKRHWRPPSHCHRLHSIYSLRHNYRV